VILSGLRASIQACDDQIKVNEGLQINSWASLFSQYRCPSNKQKWIELGKTACKNLNVACSAQNEAQL